MLKELINVISGPATFSNPGSYGVQAQPTFKKFFGNLVSAFGGTGYGGYGQAGFGGVGFPSSAVSNSQALNAYRNVQNQFIGAQGFENGNDKVLQAQVFQPGAVISPGLPVQQQPLLPQSQGFFPPPLSGGASFSNYPNQAGSVGFGQPLNTAGFPPAGLPLQGQGFGFGALSTLLTPIIGIISLIRSLFNFRKGFINPIQPVEFDKSKTSFGNSMSNYEVAKKEEGSFDEFFPEEVENSSLNLSNLQSF